MDNEYVYESIDRRLWYFETVAFVMKSNIIDEGQATTVLH